MSIPPELWAFAERHHRFFKTKECIARATESPCRGPIVRAHIIPRAQLRQIASNGHILAVPSALPAVIKMQRIGFEVDEIGIGEFSTMNCFCAGHDKALFAPIEDVPLVFSSEQIALLHYRALAAEFYQRNSQLESASSEFDWQSGGLRNNRFFWIYIQNLKAVEESDIDLMRTEEAIAARRFGDFGCLVVRFNIPPAVLAVGAFRPQYDFSARRVQQLADDCTYVAMHLLAAGGKAVLAFTWIRGDAAPEQFARSFVAQPQERKASLAVQCAFEHIEHACMSHSWWSGLRRPLRAALLERVRRAHSLSYRRSPRCLAYRLRYADWPVARVR